MKKEHYNFGFYFGEARSLIVIFGGSSKYGFHFCLSRANKIKL
jgi:hypothetical protein